MPADAETHHPPDRDGTAGLGRLFTLILVIQVVVTAALYWFGRHFS